MSDAAARVADATGNWVDTPRAVLVAALSAARASRPADRLLAAADAVLVVGGAGRRRRPRVSRLPLILALFFVGAFVMRGAGCTWNDITDRDLDARVERTRSRPIPSGQVSVRAGGGLSGRAGAGRPCGAAAVQPLRIVTGVASLVIVAIYPFMKRITWWPQIVLGLAFSWGALMGLPDARADRCAGALALCRLDRLGDRLRHHLCASGRRGRRADRHEIDGAAVRRAHRIRR